MTGSPSPAGGATQGQCRQRRLRRGRLSSRRRRLFRRVVARGALAGTGFRISIWGNAMDQKNEFKIIGNNRGMVLVVALLLISILVVVGTTAVMTTTTDMKISTNYRESVKALYDAEAGIHYTIGRIKSNALPLPVAVNVPTPASLAPPTGFSFSGITIENLGSNRYRLIGTGNAANSALKTIQLVIKAPTSVLPGADGALAMYGGDPEVHFRLGSGGGFNVDGHDYPLPASFACVGSACRTTPLTTGAPGLYSADEAEIYGDAIHHLGGEPIRVEGGTSLHTNDDWNTFVDYILANNLYVQGQMGTREQPLVTLIGNGAMLGGNMNGAGIIIVDSGGQLDVHGSFHFEGLVILRGSGTFVGNGTGNIFGSTITIEHDYKSADLDGTVDILYSGAALDNLNNIGGLRAITLTSWRDTSLP